MGAVAAGPIDDQVARISIQKCTGDTPQQARAQCGSISVERAPHRSCAVKLIGAEQLALWTRVTIPGPPDLDLIDPKFSCRNGTRWPDSPAQICHPPAQSPQTDVLIRNVRFGGPVLALETMTTSDNPTHRPRSETPAGSARETPTVSIRSGLGYALPHVQAPADSVHQPCSRSTPTSCCGVNLHACPFPELLHPRRLRWRACFGGRSGVVPYMSATHEK